MTAVKFAEGSDTIIEGLALPFGGPFEGKDFHGEKFGPETDIVPDLYPNGRPLLYHHGLNTAMEISVQGRQFEHETTDEGIFARAELDKSAKYHATVTRLIKAGKLSFSSGAIPHLVKTTADGLIERWPWMELSLTPTPANPDARVTYAVKAADHIEHLNAAGLDLTHAILKTIVADEPEDSGSESFDAHAERVASVVGEFVKRADARIEVRAAKAGRELSVSNRTWLQSLDERLAAVTNLRAEVQEALSRTDPDAKKAVAELEVELLLSDLRRAGVLTS